MTTVQERPIIFSGDMVKAVLEGRKTQTRRVMKPQPSAVDDAGRWYRMPGGGESLHSGYDCPYGLPGTRLWVRETWCGSVTTEVFPVAGQRRSIVAYRANCEGDEEAPVVGDCWRSPIHMPRWASRITLEVVSVRAERLQDITEADAVAEGCAAEWHKNRSTPDGPGELDGCSAVDDFAALWDSINGRKPGRSWADNPFVWVVAFRRIEP